MNTTWEKVRIVESSAAAASEGLSMLSEHIQTDYEATFPECD